MSKLRILWASNGPNVQSGYGIPTRMILPYLQEMGCEVALQAFYGVHGGGFNYEGIKIYPSQGHPYGVDVVSAHAKHFAANLVVTLIDNWVLPREYGSLFEAKWLSWFPVDGTPVPAPSAEMATLCDYPAVFSRDGVQKLADAGIEAHYLPYGVDCSTFKPVDDKNAVRDELGIPPDVFFIVTVGSNRGFPARKSWPEILMAFKFFVNKYPNARLHLHTRMKPISVEGIEFAPLMRTLGLGQEVSFADRIALAVGVQNEDLAKLYQAADVMLLPSMGEGFGLPIAEAQACGTPVITNACSSMVELTVNGIAIEPLQPFWVPHLNYFWHTASVPSIVSALERIYMRTSYETATGALNGVDHFRDNYDWPVVFDRHWRPLLERIEGELW